MNKRWRKLLGGLVAAGALMTMGNTASAIRNGQPDGENHPMVGIMVARDEAGAPLWRCTGTFVSSTIFLTAGHCTEAPATSAIIWTQSDMRPVNGVAPCGYPTGDGSCPSWTGTTHVHPNFYDGPFHQHDLGVVELTGTTYGGPIATIPSGNVFDELLTRRGQNRTTFTAVGYGLQRAFPDANAEREVAERIRMFAELRLINGDSVFGGRNEGAYVVFSNNANTGGTCFGDSGGPIFRGSSLEIVAVTSFGVNSNCAGTGGGYRIDQPDDLQWLASFGVVG